MRESSGRTRRGILVGAGAAVTASLAGCSGLPFGDDEATVADVGADSVANPETPGESASAGGSESGSDSESDGGSESGSGSESDGGSESPPESASPAGPESTADHDGTHEEPASESDDGEDGETR